MVTPKRLTDLISVDIADYDHRGIHCRPEGSQKSCTKGIPNRWLHTSKTTRQKRAEGAQSKSGRREDERNAIFRPACWGSGERITMTACTEAGRDG